MDTGSNQTGLSASDLSALCDPAAYPFDPGARDGVELVQTHISCVFLTRDLVYKFRKPVALGFLDFTSRAERTADCLRELNLNRRLTSDVYLGLAPLLRSADGPRIGKLSEHETPDAEHCVVMRRLPHGRDALSLLEAGRLEPVMLERLARFVAAFHARTSLGTPAPWSLEEWRTRFARPARDNVRVLRSLAPELAPPPVVDRIEAAAERFLEERAADIERRRIDGRVVDGHGDLHLEHVWYLSSDAEPLAIDCIEFNDNLRKIDAAAEVAFLAMDLAYRGHADLGDLFLRSYADASGDYHLYTVVDYHIAYRACVRAKVAALTASDPSVPPHQRERATGSARRHLAFAADALARERRASLILLCGVVGTGKSTVANVLSEVLEAPCISSDRIRERLLADVPRAERYTDARRKLVYTELLRAAANILSSGRIVVLDATFETAAQRADATRVAREARADAWLVETTGEPSVVLQRLRSRAAAGLDPSDAGPEQYEASVARFERPTEWHAERAFTLATDREDWRYAVEPIARRIRAGTR